ncbi:MAG: phage tail tube protein [Pirellulaceae bacterium]
MAEASQGVQARLCMEPGAAPHTFDASSEPYEFLAESLRKRTALLDTSGIRGTRSHHAARTRVGAHAVSGSISLHPSPGDLDHLLPRILGADEASDVFVLAETLPSFGVLIDRVAETFQYTDCRVSKATFRGSAGGLVLLVLDIVGVAEVTGVSFPSLLLDTTAQAAPYTFSDGVLTLQSAQRQMMDFELVIDNGLQARFTNSQTATSIVPQDRIVTLKTTNPFTSDEVDLYGQPAVGAAGSLMLTNGQMSTTFAFAALQSPDTSPVVPGKQEIPLVLEMTARMTGTTRELIVTNDSQP